MKQTRNFAEFWSSLSAEAQVYIFDVYLANLTNTYKVKDNILTKFIIMDALILP
jgi:hypothetical protein